MTNADKIRSMSNWELCESSEDYCMYQIGEWLINESNK